MIKVGILELQGDFGLHHKILQELGYDSYSVKESADLESLDGLIIPGGESTTMSLLIDSFNLRKSILDFSKENPILGTCAGLIICLLYTSPSPRDRQKSRMPSSA